MAVIIGNAEIIIISEHAKAYSIKYRYIKERTGEIKMASNNQTLIPEARAALDKFKMEAASEVGVTLNQGYNGDLTAKQAGSVGGQMVKKMIAKYENDMKGK